MLENTLSDALRVNHCENFGPVGRLGPPGLPVSQAVCLNVDISDQIFALNAD